MRVYFYVLISAILGLDPFAPIEHSLEKQLSEKIAGLDSVSIKICASRLAFLFLGICRTVTVEMRGLPTDALRIDSFRIVAEKFRFKPFSTFILNRPIVLGGETKWNIRITDTDIQEYIVSRGPLLRGVTVHIEPEIVTLRRSSSIATALNMKEPLSVSGCLVLDDNKNVALDLEHFHSFGIGPGRTLLKSVLRLVNPILPASDINRLLNKPQDGPLESVKLTAAFENICMDHGHIDVHGSINAERIPKKEAEPKPKPEPEPKKGKKSTLINKEKLKPSGKIRERKQRQVKKAGGNKRKPPKKMKEE
jgi:hypothetical protein